MVIRSLVLRTWFLVLDAYERDGQNQEPSTKYQVPNTKSTSHLHKHGRLVPVKENALFSRSNDLQMVWG